MKESIRNFCNKAALNLNPSNDTMKAIRLLHKMLPEYLESEITKAVEEEREVYISILKDHFGIQHNEFCKKER